MSKITLQEIFDNAWQTFIVDGSAPSLQPRTMKEEMAGACRMICAYENPQGRRCAIGVTLAKHFSEQDFARVVERNPKFSDVIDQYPEYFSKEIIAMNHRFSGEPGAVDDFQADLHDHLVYDTSGDWNCTLEERELIYRQIAKNYNLTVPTP